MNKKLLIASLLMIPIMFSSLMQGCGQDKSAVPEAKTNEPKWSYDSGAPIYSSPVVLENNVIFGNSHSKVIAVDKDTQKENWSYQLDGQITNQLLLDGNKVIVTSYSTCYALDGKTGKELWKYTTNEKTKSGVKDYDYHAASPALYMDLVIYPTHSGKIFALNKETGEKLWDYKNEEVSDIRTTPTFYDDVMVLGDIQGFGYAVDMKTQKTLWTKKVGSQVVHATFAYKGYAYFAGRDAYVYAYDLKTGEKKWEYKEPVGSWFLSDITIKDDILYVPGSDNHRVVGLNYESGQPAGSYYSKANILCKPVIVDNMMYYTEGNVYNEAYGALVAHDLNNKEVAVWITPQNKPIYSTPAVADKMLYFGSTDGKLYAVGIE